MQGHDFDYANVFHSDVSRDGKNLVQIWCKTHGRYEWRWLTFGGAATRHSATDREGED